MQCVDDRVFQGSGIDSFLAMKRPGCARIEIGQIHNANICLPTSAGEIRKLSLGAFDFSDPLLGRKWLRDPSRKRAPTSCSRRERGHAG
ncbi:hypothetical protein MESS4_790120 [Mesorhizobium sp. STM 4661]|nr:hypothetical protein MESS4_790120 [Mesorhizobium sp. STM 4661]